MSLHDRIMRIPTKREVENLRLDLRLHYKGGHKVARHAAAEIALEADEIMDEMAICLSELIEVAEGSEDYGDRVAAKVPAMALKRYNAWKESAK